MKAFILLGVESSGNHLLCSLFSRMTMNGVPMQGTDMLGWTDGVRREHDLELFNNVWLGFEKLQVDGRPIVTSRSFPCGLNWPNVRMFWQQCLDAHYQPTVAVIVRDYSITLRSTINRLTMGTNVHQKWDLLFEALNGIPYRFISYEALVYLRKRYLMHWLQSESETFEIADEWFDRIIDANAKYIRES